MRAYLDTAPTPAGPAVFAITEAGALAGLHFLGGSYLRTLEEELTTAGFELTADETHTAAVRQQLEEYAAGQRADFDIALDLRGTDWQKTVWRALLDIPAGETRSYAELAVMAGRPGAARAAGGANGANPIPLVVPCHRVIGSDGSLTGYGGGLHIKAALLAHEARMAAARTTAKA